MGAAGVLSCTSISWPKRGTLHGHALPTLFMITILFMNMNMNMNTLFQILFTP